ncbi:uncharacterized protein ARMOST_21594 [Armillaria ostoyae]|uniref:Uncharacterized protein n=1 Tax=Armillaria ostoyae TaxID=47428 RepID=A0A284SAI5_ARMOS|nr:uncharacterized protein ARMOST_21594 [Armillaria ostoyae]
MGTPLPAARGRRSITAYNGVFDAASNGRPPGNVLAMKNLYIGQASLQSVHKSRAGETDHSMSLSRVAKESEVPQQVGEATISPSLFIRFFRLWVQASSEGSAMFNAV